MPAFGDSRKRKKISGSRRGSQYGASASVAYMRGYPPMVNHEAETEHAREDLRTDGGAHRAEAG